MPIKITNDTISGKFMALGSAIQSSVESAAGAAEIESTNEMVARARRNEFWTNRSFNALNSIGGEVETGRRFISLAVGFEEGKPNEADAPQFYKGKRNREYAEYIADRERTRFLSNVLQSIVRNISRALDNVGHSVGNMNTSRASYVKKGEE